MPSCTCGSWSGAVANICLHSVHEEAQLVAEGLVAVRRADVRHVRPPYVVAGRPVLQVVGTEEVLLLLRATGNIR